MLNCFKTSKSFFLDNCSFLMNVFNHLLISTAHITYEWQHILSKTIIIKLFLLLIIWAVIHRQGYTKQQKTLFQPEMHFYINWSKTNKSDLGRCKNSFDHLQLQAAKIIFINFFAATHNLNTFDTIWKKCFKRFM